MSRTMIIRKSVVKHLRVEVLNATCYIQNVIYIIPMLNTTPYELWKGREPNIAYFHQFDCTLYELNTNTH